MRRITYKKPAEIDRMREAGRIVSTVLAALRDAALPGVTTAELDRYAGDLIEKHGARSSFLGHRMGELVFPHQTCLSVNDEVVHGMASPKRKLREGDIISLDVGVKLKGYHADSALTVPVGRIPDEVQRLLDVTRASLWAGLRAVRPRGRVQDIAHAIQKVVEPAGFTLVRELTGHGIGTQLWEAPEIYNVVENGRPNPPFLEGMTLAIEPMVNLGKPEIGVLPDGWTIVTADGKPSAHFEHTVAVTRFGYEILTLGPHDAGELPAGTGAGPKGNGEG